jgi:hypothetical protein
MLNKIYFLVKKLTDNLLSNSKIGFVFSNFSSFLLTWLLRKYTDAENKEEFQKLWNFVHNIWFEVMEEDGSETSQRQVKKPDSRGPQRQLDQAPTGFAFVLLCSVSWWNLKVIINHFLFLVSRGDWLHSAHLPRPGDSKNLTHAHSWGCGFSLFQRAGPCRSCSRLWV